VQAERNAPFQQHFVMMRNGIVSVVKRNSKRNNNKETAPPQAPAATSHTAPAVSVVPQPAPKQLLEKDSNGNNGVRKTKPTPEEATLTAKNYRLAKELVC
jgi:hypothetical protein